MTIRGRRGVRAAMLRFGHSWYYERPNTPTQADRDVALRDAIERLGWSFRATAR